ncbi:AraC family transcriptional regulator [Azospirillum sp.]|uniref:AraC family transcriptional regulator n=1 Tax=Azospirillum sp. TaxID=34012 RepID=UPI002D3AB08C|nr:AraC family transcriptional regulator [Azospirillum sp.]HYF88056.1 AraC family transcriptional regulator [Azospirillum sp.]
MNMIDREPMVTAPKGLSIDGVAFSPVPEASAGGTVSAAESLLKVARHILGRDHKTIEECLLLALTQVQISNTKLVLKTSEAEMSVPFRTGLAPWQVRRVTAYIDGHLELAIRNKDLAAIAKMNCRCFHRAFKNSFGLPPHAYIIQRRVTRAKEMLETTNEPLSQITLSCGFSDQSHFSRIFHRFAGETPRMWRRRHQRELVHI